MYVALQLIVFQWKQIQFVLWFKIRFYPILRCAFMIKIYFSWYVEFVKSFLSQKSQFDPVEKIKNINKYRTCASLFQSLEGGKQDIFLCGLIPMPNTIHSPRFSHQTNKILIIPIIKQHSCEHKPRLLSMPLFSASLGPQLMLNEHISSNPHDSFQG